MPQSSPASHYKPSPAYQHPNSRKLSELQLQLLDERIDKISIFCDTDHTDGYGRVMIHDYNFPGYELKYNGIFSKINTHGFTSTILESHLATLI